MVNHNLTESDLGSASLFGANLTDADLSRARLAGASLTRANLQGVKGYRP